MSVFEIIKESVSIGSALKYYGLNFKRGKALCCFHSEKDPSLTYSESKKIFKCHSCGVTGDVIAFTSKLFSVSSIEACKKINDDFRLGINITKPTTRDLLVHQNKITIQKNKIAKEKQDFQDAVNLYKKYEKMIEESEPYSAGWCYAKNKILIAEYRCLAMIGVS